MVIILTNETNASIARRKIKFLAYERRPTLVHWQYGGIQLDNVRRYLCLECYDSAIFALFTIACTSDML